MAQGLGERRPPADLPQPVRARPAQAVQLGEVRAREPIAELYTRDPVPQRPVRLVQSQGQLGGELAAPCD